MQDNNIIQEAINTLKRLHKENIKLKTHIEDRDEYIASLLLSLFLMQIEINRLNETLDLARKGELVYINNPQIAELKTENERLKKENRYYKAELRLSCNELDKSEKWQVFERRKKNEYYTALNEIEKQFKKEYTRLVYRNCFGAYPKECKRCLHDGSCLQQKVLNIINSTKAESEDN